MTPRPPPPVDSASQEASHRTKPLLRLTWACNERCPFCNVPVEDYEVRTPPMEEVRAQLAEILASGAQTLTISGGEPTLYRDRLVTLCREATDGGMHFIEIQSNAVLIDDDYAQAMAAAGVTSGFISLLSHEPAQHDRLAGLEGAFEPCLRGIDALLDAGIRVALNPVVAYESQEMLPDYVDFIAQRFPRIRSISCSAVQPHGRAARQVDLLPDYAVLAQAIREARVRADVHGIELLNPYCGVPLCIGWEDTSERSVEAFEALRGGFDTPGLDNTGNKRQGAPCHGCALHARCGGAWHAYWEVRDGSGIAAPFQSLLPWEVEVEPPHQHIVHAPGGPTESHWEQIDQSEAPSVWLWTDRLASEDLERVTASRCTDIAWEMAAGCPDEQMDTLRCLRALQRRMRGLADQARVQIWWGIVVPDDDALEDAARAVALAEAMDAAGVRLLAGKEVAMERFLEALRLRHPGLDISAIKTHYRAVSSLDPRSASN